MKLVNTLISQVIIVLFLSACSSTRSGQYVRIGHPYAIDEISKVYKVSVNDIKNFNPTKGLNKGDWIFVPKSSGMMISSRSPAGRSLENINFIWPLQFSTIKVSSDYGYRGFRHHDGVDLPAPRKTQIVAAADGKVVNSSRLKGYGKTIIISHGGGIETLYAHNSENVVKNGAFVRQGQVIALVGATGRATGNHLHFEIRDNGNHKDPLSYLPNNKTIAFQ